MEVIARSPKGSVTASLAGDTLRLSVEGYIGKWDDANAKGWKEQIAAYKEEAKKVLIYINSYGGEVFEANEMVNVVREHFSDVRVEVGAVAASAATYFLAKFPSRAKRNTQIMIHRPQVCTCGHIGRLESTAKLLSNLTEQYIKDYTAKMKLSAEELEKKWADDWWMTAAEALKYGLIDAIDDEDAPVDTVTMSILNQLHQGQTPKSSYMNDVIAAKLGLTPGADEKSILERIAELQAAAKRAEELEKKMKQQAEAERKARIKALLDQAEADHKITADMRAQYEALAEKDFDSVKAIIEQLPALTEAPSASLKLQGGKAPVNAERANWTYADWAEKDPEGFEKLPEAVQKKLIDEHYNEQ